MKRILKLLARLYPLSWRTRYGAEYEALLEEASPRPRDAFDVFWGAIKMQMTAQRFARIVLPCTLVGGIAAFAISFARPALYRSQTLILVDTDDRHPIGNQLRGQVVDLLNQPFLASVIQQEDLYPSERSRTSLESVVLLMSKNIEIRKVQTSDGKSASALVLQFDYPDPHVAQRVDEMLASQFIAANLRAGAASATSEFLKGQLLIAKDPAIKTRIQSQLRQVETATSQLHRFRVLNVASLPKKPTGLSRTELGLIGLFAGFLSGTIAAAILDSHQRATN